jgi:hypothetical protein
MTHDLNVQGIPKPHIANLGPGLYYRIERSCIIFIVEDLRKVGINNLSKNRYRSFARNCSIGPSFILANRSSI